MTDLIPYIIGAIVALIGAGGLVRWLSDRAGKKPPTEPVPPAPPEPEHTAEEHETALVLEEADIIDAAAADHNADPNKVGELMDLADATREDQ